MSTESHWHESAVLRIRRPGMLPAAPAVEVGVNLEGGQPEDADGVEPAGEPCVFGELDHVAFEIHSRPPFVLSGLEVELRLGNVPIASTSPQGPDEVRLNLAATQGPGSSQKLESIAFQPFIDWAGATVLSLQARKREDETSRRVAALPLRVIPQKITEEEFEHLLEDLESAASGLLYEAYAKTTLSLGVGGRTPQQAPAEKLEHVRGALNLFGTQLARMANRPAQRLNLRPRRVDISPGEAITPETVARIAEDTSILARTQLGILPRERIDMTAERDVKLPEHAEISGFLELLAQELSEVLREIHIETDARLGRQAAFAGGESGIWKQREEPRIRALHELQRKARMLFGHCRDLRRRHDFLSWDVPALRRPPDLTKRFTNVGAYSILYRAMVEHFKGHPIDLDAGSIQVAIKNVPTLWEYWVVLKVIRWLQRKLRYAASPWESPESLFRRVIGPRDRYVLELGGDRRLEFLDSSGRRVLCRYQPHYCCMSRRQDPPRGFGRLQRFGAPFEPDIAVEVYAPGDEDGAVPEHIVILDAKYTSRSHDIVLQSLLRYRNIGEFRTGRRLVRQIWAVASSRKAQNLDDEAPRRLEDYITADNEAFFQSTFSGLGEVCGVIGVRPEKEKAAESLEAILERAFGVLGVI